MLLEVIERLKSGKYVGGGVRVKPERLSLGIFCSVMVVIPFIIWPPISAGMFWCFKSDFDAVGKFDESLVCVEDVEFARRLKAYGKGRSQRWGTIRNAWITTSCRKFDQFGDWYFVRNPKVVFEIFNQNRKTADGFYYDARQTDGEPSDDSRYDA